MCFALTGETLVLVCLGMATRVACNIFEAGKRGGDGWGGEFRETPRSPPPVQLGVLAETSQHL